MRRRRLLQSTLGVATALAMPAVARAQDKNLLKFIPQSDLAATDPVWTTADVTRNFGFMVYDTLYGLDTKYRAQPQMVQGHTVSSDAKQWDLTLRDGQKFHDGTPVLARDAVASIQRWAKRDGFGGQLMAATDEISAASDKVIRFRLKRPFPLLPDALATPTDMCCIVPERLAQTDPNKQMPEVVGSGPFRFLPSERISGAKIACARNTAYQPRQEPTSFTAGGKPVHFDRVEWTVVPDPATASAALSSGEVDWWEDPSLDLVPTLTHDHSLVVTVKDHSGEIGCLRFNQMYPPFDNPAIRRVVVEAVNQQNFMQAVAGSVPNLIKTGIGLFAAASPYASNVGVDTMKGDADPAALKQALAAAGYKGERVVVLGAADFPTITAIALVGADMMRKIGLNVDYQSMDWGTVVQRRESKSPPDKGGWNVFFTFLGGTGNIIPAADIAIRSGPNAWFGWPRSTRQQALLTSWFSAPDLAAQQKVMRELQADFFQDPSYAPLGMYSMPTAFKRTLTGIPEGFPLFYGVKRTP
ncbi:MAG TPA: ABC transporter substrate-binding protein [Acetobacteraceae bacterium]|jgi:peptide/nickel transport system substrate-binding protein|nr:ABC transporter substrate-binding protein [Acetobacteraceae bacterium]